MYRSTVVESGSRGGPLYVERVPGGGDPSVETDRQRQRGLLLVLGADTSVQRLVELQSFYETLCLTQSTVSFVFEQSPLQRDVSVGGGRRTALPGRVGVNDVDLYLSWSTGTNRV